MAGRVAGGRAVYLFEILLCGGLGFSLWGTSGEGGETVNPLNQLKQEQGRSTAGHRELDPVVVVPGCAGDLILLILLVGGSDENGLKHF